MRRPCGHYTSSALASGRQKTVCPVTCHWIAWPSCVLAPRGLKARGSASGVSPVVDESQVLVTETLNVRGMMRNRCLARAIVDAGWGELRRQIAYKAQWAQRTHIEVDPWFPSTRRCSGCHALHAGLTLADRHWRCEACGAEHDRDVNAACNLEQEGLRLLTGQRPAGPGRSMRVEGNTPGPPPARSG
ncbi:MAG: transposase, partial [Rhodospirillaceae bacterium]|nr:transposase [Rhodospirillaceae bacterium]